MKQALLAIIMSMMVFPTIGQALEPPTDEVDIAEHSVPQTDLNFETEGSLSPWPIMNKPVGQLLAQAEDDSEQEDSDSVIPDLGPFPISPSPEKPKLATTEQRVKAVQQELQRVELKKDQAEKMLRVHREALADIHKSMDVILKTTGKAHKDMKYTDDPAHNIVVDAYDSHAQQIELHLYEIARHDLDLGVLKSALKNLPKKGVTVPLPDGGSIQTFANGREIHHFPDGGSVEVKPDGTHISKTPGMASQTITLPDGSTQTTLGSGYIIITKPSTGSTLPQHQIISPHGPK